MEKLELKSEHPDYVKVHCWLRRRYGNANLCMSAKCSGESNSFHWALLHGCNYEKNRNNFITLCQSCHKKYDMTDLTRSKMSISKQGSRHPKSKLQESDVLEIRNNYDNTPSYSKRTAEKYKVSWHTINYILKRKTWIHI